MLKEFWRGRSVLVTGADGIVGSWLVKALLARKAKVTALIRDHNERSELFVSGDVRRIKIIDGELEDFNLLVRGIRTHKIDTVFHLGAQAIVAQAYLDPLETFESNIRGTYNILEACRREKVNRVVVASSDKAYGEHKNLPYVENMELKGRYPYEMSKSCTDLIAQSYFHSYALPVAIVRCGNIYGGGDLNFNRIVPGTIMDYLKAKRPEIRSNGKFIRDYIYVKDVCEAYIAVAEHLLEKKLAGHGFNCSDEKPLTVLGIVKAIAYVMDCASIKPKVLNTAKGEIPAQYLSSAKIRRILKWRPKYDLTQGLIETVEWYKNFEQRQSK